MLYERRPLPATDVVPSTTTKEAKWRRRRMAVIMAIVVGCCLLPLTSHFQRYTIATNNSSRSESKSSNNPRQVQQQYYSNNANVDTTKMRQGGVVQVVGIAVVSDRRYQSLQEPLLKTVQSYAARHGYEYHVLEPSPSCGQLLRNFFFVKHCTVREFLSSKKMRQQHPHGSYALFVLDGDVVAAAPEVSLSRWVERDVDLLFYERDWNFEIMAGNYMVRNTEFALDFLYKWEQFDYRARSIEGFHSYDNGAIHLVVLQVLDHIIPVQDYIACDRLYQTLTDTDVRHLDQYYAFVACTRRALGPNRRWHVKGGRSVLTVLHRYHGFAVDGFIAGRRPGGGIPFYHGEKDPKEAVKHYGFTEPWKSATEQSLAIDETYWISSYDAAYKVVPRVDLSSCMKDFSCEPAPMDGMPPRDVYGTHNATTIFQYEALYNRSRAS